jgi:hypothetical protein
MSARPIPDLTPAELAAMRSAERAQRAERKAVANAARGRRVNRAADGGREART